MTKFTEIHIGTSIDDRFEQKRKIVSKYSENVSKEFDTLFNTDEEKAIANIALDICSRLLFEYLKEEAEYGR